MAVVGHGHRLGEALGLVVDAAGADRVDVAPVGLGLRVHLRVAVDLAGRGQEEAGALGLGQAEGVVGAEAADLQGLDRHLEVVDGRRRAGEVHARRRPAPGTHTKRLTSCSTNVKPWLAEEVLDVGGRAGDEVVDADDLVAPGEQGVGEVRAEEAGPAGDDDAGHQAQTRPMPA